MHFYVFVLICQSAPFVRTISQWSEDSSDGDWSLFPPFPSTQDYGLGGTAGEQASVPLFQSTGDDFMDFSGNDFLSPLGELCASPISHNILAFSSHKGIKFTI